MKKLLRLSVLLSLFMLTFSICNAQKNKPKKTPEQKSVEMTAKLSKDVKLTKAQATKIKAVYLEYIKEKEALEEKIDALKKERNEKINVVLTDDQKKKREALKKKKKK